jgi:hypothetical protein
MQCMSLSVKLAYQRKCGSVSFYSQALNKVLLQVTSTQVVTVSCFIAFQMGKKSLSLSGRVMHSQVLSLANGVSMLHSMNAGAQMY